MLGGVAGELAADGRRAALQFTGDFADRGPRGSPIMDTFSFREVQVTPADRALKVNQFHLCVEIGTRSR